MSSPSCKKETGAGLLVRRCENRNWCWDGRAFSLVMIQYDQQCTLEFAELQPRFDEYFVEMAVECPYHLPHEALFYQALFAPVPERVMELFLAHGYRRNGNCLYAMHCAACSACVPIRLHPQGLRLNRNQSGRELLFRLLFDDDCLLYGNSLPVGGKAGRMRHC